jgi:hypothetical protein
MEPEQSGEATLSLSQLERGTQAVPAPEAPAQEEAAPTEEVPAAETTEEEPETKVEPVADPAKDYIRRLETENAQYRERTQTLLEAQSKLQGDINEKLMGLLKAKEPSKTPEQLEEEAKDFWKNFDKDPKATIAESIKAAIKELKLDEAAKAAVKAELGDTLEQVAPFRYTAQKLEFYDKVAKIKGFEHVADPAFQKVMESKEAIEETIGRFYGEDFKAEAAFKTREWYERLSVVASEIARSKPAGAQGGAAAPGPTSTSQSDQDALRRVAAGEAKGGAASAKAGKPVEVDPVTAGMLKSGQNSLQKLAADAKWA